jgi:Zn-dependent alcohol dehydrogenase
MTIEELKLPRPQVGEVLIRTKACGVCHSDLHVMNNDIPFPIPCVLGHEVSGEVVEHGKHTDSATIERLPVGSRVVGAFIMPCGGCFFCVKGQEDLCESFLKYNRGLGGLYDGTTRLYMSTSGDPVYMYSMGGLAEYCVVPANGLAVIPESLPYSESAILGCAVFTAYGAMKNAADMRAGETVAVIGTGGVGSSCIQVSRAFGGRIVIGVDISDGKLEMAKQMGATHTINASKEDVPERIREITGGRGVDIAVEALGKPATFKQAIMSVRDGGRAVMIGVAPWGATADVEITRLVRRQIRVIGSYGGRARQDLPNIVGLAELGFLKIESAVTQKAKLEQASNVYAELEQGRITGRAVIELR